jgi:hypothetical protein
MRCVLSSPAGLLDCASASTRRGRSGGCGGASCHALQGLDDRLCDGSRSLLWAAASDASQSVLPAADAEFLTGANAGGRAEQLATDGLALQESRAGQGRTTRNGALLANTRTVTTWVSPLQDTSAARSPPARVRPWACETTSWRRPVSKPSSQVSEAATVSARCSVPRNGAGATGGSLFAA